jgi:hypothetical protein
MAADAQLIVALVTAINAAASLEVVRRLVSAVRRRKVGDRQRENVEVEIERIVADQPDNDSTVSDIIRVLNTTDDAIHDAVVVLGDQVLIKDSAAGTPKVVVRKISPDQREKISKRQAPMNDAALFHAWLDDTRQPESSG